MLSTQLRKRSRHVPCVRVPGRQEVSRRWARPGAGSLSPLMPGFKHGCPERLKAPQWIGSVPKPAPAQAEATAARKSHVTPRGVGAVQSVPCEAAVAVAPRPLAAAEEKRTRKRRRIVNGAVRVGVPKLTPSVSQLNSTVGDSVHHTRVWHSFKRVQELCLCLFCEWARGDCCIFAVGDKCHWFCLIATGKMETSVFMPWPSRMKRARFGSPCSCCSQNGGSSNSSWDINSKRKRWSQVLRTPLSFGRWAEGWQNHVTTVLFSAGLIWICWLPSALCNSMKRLIIRLHSARAIKPRTSPGINWFWKSAAGLEVTVKLQKWEPDSIAGFTEWVWTFGRSSLGDSCC